MTDETTPQDASRTFKQLGDNPLKANAHDILNSNLENGVGSFKLLLRRLERSMTKGIRAYWNVGTSSEYLSIKRLPRGLRIKKCPSFELQDEALKKQWTDAVSTCSSTLVNIILMSKQKEMDALQQEILVSQNNLLDCYKVQQIS